MPPLVLTLFLLLLAYLLGSVSGSLLLGRHGSLTPAWLEVLVHPDDRDLVADAIARARATQSTFSAEHRIRNEAGGWSWIASRAVPIGPIGGEVTEWFGAATDITARRQHEEHQRLLLNELNHRVKNTLAIVQSIVEAHGGRVEAASDAASTRFSVLLPRG